jgi:hypothetical protein
MVDCSLFLYLIKAFFKNNAQYLIKFSKEIDSFCEYNLIKFKQQFNLRFKRWKKKRKATIFQQKIL